jgi:hypothetical protein
MSTNARTSRNRRTRARAVSEKPLCIFGDWYSPCRLQCRRGTVTRHEESWHRQLLGHRSLDAHQDRDHRIRAEIHATLIIAKNREAFGCRRRNPPSGSRGPSMPGGISTTSYGPTTAPSIRHTIRKGDTLTPARRHSTPCSHRQGEPHVERDPAYGQDHRDPCG